MDKSVEVLEEGLMEYITEQTRLTNFRGPTPMPEELKEGSNASEKDKALATERRTEALLKKPCSQLTKEETEEIAEGLRAYLRSINPNG